MKPWQIKLLEATRYNETFTGAILCRIMFVPDYHDKKCPRFVGTAYHTSDGFLMCDFVTHDGEHKHGAFVGTWTDVWTAFVKLADHCGLTVEERKTLIHYLKSWVRWN